MASIFFVSQTALLNVGGSTQRQMFVTAAGTVFVYSILILILSMYGHVAQYYQFRPLEAVKFNAPTIFRWFLYSLAGVILMEVGCLALSVYFVYSSQYESSKQSLYAFVFNAVYFAHAQNDSNAIHPKGFWEWIASNCPVGLSEDYCLKPFPYSAANCAADWNLCYGRGSACPFDMCKDSVIRLSSALLFGACSVLSMFTLLHCVALGLGYFAYEEVEDFFIKHAVKFEKKRFNPKYAVTSVSMSSADARRDSRENSSRHSAFQGDDTQLPSTLYAHLIDGTPSTVAPSSRIPYNTNVRYTSNLPEVQEGIENMESTPEPASSGDSLDDGNSDTVPLPEGVLKMLSDIISSNIPRRVSRRLRNLAALQVTFDLQDSLDSYEQRV